MSHSLGAEARPKRDEIASDRLEAWLRQHVEGYRGPLRIERFAGGQSNPTFKLCAASGDYVLRRKPVGNVLPSAHAVDREFRVLSALAGTGVPVPRVHALCTDDAVIGSMFYVMDLVPGRVFWDPRLPELSKEERGAIFDSMNDTIAKIHALDPDALGLADYGRKGAYLERQVARWSKQYRASETVPNPAMDKLIEWLPQHLPPEGETRIVHGDYRLDNLLIHPQEPRVVAVLDWELSTLGDPMADFAYHAMTWRIASELFRGLAGIDFARLGIPDEQSYLDAYLRRVGLGRPEHWEFYLVLSMFRIAAILQGIARRAIDGTAADANAKAVGAKAVPLSELAWKVAQGIDG
ncbi:aminoglycoside phosphotransferase (APT) family kinase protein [Mesorhizobium sp. J18]|uniref:phosphotransferase family protein n=1 Tax=Mesorhizobium sp. J18 TaxID=935263 RepID=UPI001199680A|nr:phosphotransferase family protein [Mesorhizobium sp. J18]TWH01166.1 aminoglycoside phosphotransferase (APT) family kinase protein [Mesorhizobium sp. J18]